MYTSLGNGSTTLSAPTCVRLAGSGPRTRDLTLIYGRESEALSTTPPRQNMPLWVNNGSSSKNWNVTKALAYTVGVHSIFDRSPAIFFFFHFVDFQIQLCRGKSLGKALDSLCDAFARWAARISLSDSFLDLKPQGNMKWVILANPASVHEFPNDSHKTSPFYEGRRRRKGAFS